MMNTLLIIYQLSNSKETYKSLSEKIKSFPDWAKLMPRVWMVRTKLSASDVRSELSSTVPGDNVILVINVTDRAWASYHLEPEIVAWMKANM